MVNEFDLIETFSEFMDYWNRCEKDNVSEEIKTWENYYKTNYPELFEKIVQDYTESGLNWEDIARDKIFPINVDRIRVMEQACVNLRKVIKDLYNDPEVLKFHLPRMTFVIYLGLGNGAGWATDYVSRPAILLGLENIVDIGWEGEIALKGLILHEMGHIIHYELRRERKINNGNGSLWTLYEEGFAQYFESLSISSESWHQAMEQPRWVEWCEDHLSYLAKLFLSEVEAGGETKRFFGSWFDVDGWKETGYYLGERVVNLLELPFNDLACLSLEDVGILMKKCLIEIS